MYNHYRELFAVESTGILRASAIDAVYCFSSVFRGEFRLHLVNVSGGGGAPGERAVEVIRRAPFVMPPDNDTGAGGFDAVVGDGSDCGEAFTAAGPSTCGDVAFVIPGGSTWKCEVEDDPAYPCVPVPIRFLTQQEVLQFTPLAGAAAGGNARGTAPGALRVAEATAALRAVDPEELRSGSDRVKALLAERDLEDVLYSAGSAAPV